MRFRAQTALAVLLLLAVIAAVPLAGCTSTDGGGAQRAGGASDESTAQLLPESAYYVNPKLEKWVDEETGYDTTRSWSVEDETYPVVIIMSPAQSPQLLVGMREGIFEKKLKPLGIELAVEKIDGPPRTFHALERSKWAFVYAPLAVYMDYVRSADNQGGAGGLQYVLLTGSTAGGGYTLMTKDPAIKSVADLKGKSVGLINYNPVPGTLLTNAVEKAGLRVGDGPDEVKLVNGIGSDQMNKFGEGGYDALVSLNIYVPQLLQMGAHKVTDFAKDTTYIPNYNVLMVERTVLEERPDVVKAFLEAHAEAQPIAAREWETGTRRLLFESWNDFFGKEKTPYAKDRYAKDLAAFEQMLGDMQSEDRLDDALVRDCFTYLDRNETWGWSGAVDIDRIYDPTLYAEVK